MHQFQSNVLASEIKLAFYSFFQNHYNWGLMTLFPIFAPFFARLILASFHLVKLLKLLPTLVPCSCVTNENRKIDHNLRLCRRNRDTFLYWFYVFLTFYKFNFLYTFGHNQSFSWHI
jgi:hypothetical protein